MALRFKFPVTAAAFLSIAVSTALYCAAYAAEAAATAQSLLFDAPYLKRLEAPATLSYSFRHDTANETIFGEAFEDFIRLEVKKSGDGGEVNVASVDVFSGKRRKSLGPYEDMQGNPVIMVFLEHDLWEMKRRIGGVPVYFRNSIRRALRETSGVEPVTVPYDGRKVNGHKITITPFVNDPNALRFKAYREKSYEFIVSDAVPGGFYRIRAWLPQAEGDGHLVEDAMTFDETGGKER